MSEDQRVVIAISTSAARTASGKLATAKYQKLKTDALYLLHLAAPSEKVMVFTEPCMQEYFAQAAKVGRFPPNIMLLHIPLPPELQANVVATRALASKETSPSKLADAA